MYKKFLATADKLEIDEYQTLLKKMREDAPRAYGFYNDAIKRRMN